MGSEDEERFTPLSALLADLLERGVGGDAAMLERAELVADQIEAYGMGSEGIRIRVRAALEDMMSRREQDGVSLEGFREKYERVMTLLHGVDTGRAEDLGGTLMEARRLLLEAEELATG